MTGQKISKRRGRWIGNLALALFLLVALFVVSIFAWPAIDARTLKAERCQVQTAEAHSGSPGYRTGPSSPVVVISTRNCGKFIWSDGVTRENMDLVARKFTPGDSYIFSSGWYSRVIMRDVLHRPSQLATFSKISE